MDSRLANAVRAEINVTPLVDVVLVLLIIFMVVGPMLTHGPASPPRASNPPDRPEREWRILLSIDRDGNLRIADDRGTTLVPTTDLVDRIEEALVRHPGSVIALEADGRLTYGDVKKAMIGIRDAGRQNLALIAVRKDRT